jgi:ABC-type uncharacterized transport system permease subunit
LARGDRSYVVLILAYLFMYRTRRGLELQAAGECPVHVNGMRYLHAIVGGGLAGAALRRASTC